MLKEDMLNLVAQGLSDQLNRIYNEKMGFALIVFRFGGDEENEKIGDYISNANKNDMIKALRECANRLEKREVIPKTIGEA
jgi:hypothetical protein